MLCLVLLFTVVGDFIEPIPTIIIFMPVVASLTESGNINPVHMGVLLIETLAFGLITPAVRAGAADGVQVRGRSLCQRIAGEHADLPGLPRHHRFHDLRAERHPVATKALHPAIRRVLPRTGGNWVHLPVR